MFFEHRDGSPPTHAMSCAGLCGGWGGGSLDAGRVTVELLPLQQRNLQGVGGMRWGGRGGDTRVCVAPPGIPPLTCSSRLRTRWRWTRSRASSARWAWSWAMRRRSSSRCSSGEGPGLGGDGCSSAETCAWVGRGGCHPKTGHRLPGTPKRDQHHSRASTSNPYTLG